MGIGRAAWFLGIRCCLRSLTPWYQNLSSAVSFTAITRLGESNQRESHLQIFQALRRPPALPFPLKITFNLLDRLPSFSSSSKFPKRPDCIRFVIRGKWLHGTALIAWGQCRLSFFSLSVIIFSFSLVLNYLQIFRKTSKRRRIGLGRTNLFRSLFFSSPITAATIQILKRSECGFSRIWEIK